PAELHEEIRRLIGPGLGPPARIEAALPDAADLSLAVVEIGGAESTDSLHHEVAPRDLVLATTERLHRVDDERPPGWRRLAAPEKRDEIVFRDVGPALGDRFPEVLGAKAAGAPLSGVPRARHEETSTRQRREPPGDFRERLVSERPER